MRDQHRLVYRATPVSVDEVGERLPLAFERWAALKSGGAEK
jgi:hypothetical protein